MIFLSFSDKKINLSPIQAIKKGNSKWKEEDSLTLIKNKWIPY
jgi:hypothetical protein